jgi:hypothetical protein
MPRAVCKKCLVFAKTTRSIVVSPYSFEDVTGKSGLRRAQPSGRGLEVWAGMTNDEVRMTNDESIALGERCAGNGHEKARRCTKTFRDFSRLFVAADVLISGFKDMEGALLRTEL